MYVMPVYGTGLVVDPVTFFDVLEQQCGRCAVTGTRIGRGNPGGMVVRYPNDPITEYNLAVVSMAYLTTRSKKRLEHTITL